jgi:AraC-like DNA-binding protein
MHNGITLGGNEQQILSQAGLTLPQLMQGKSRILPTQLASVVKSCWQLSGDELLGFAEQKIKLGMFSLLAERLIRCKSLAEVFSQSAAFYTLSGDQLQLKIARSASQVRVSISINFKKSPNIKPTPSLLTELLLLICHRFASWLVGQVIPLSEVNVQHVKPEHHEEYQLMYPCLCNYQSRDNALVFDASYLNLAVVQKPDDLSSYLKQIPLQWFKKQNYYESCSAQVVQILENAAQEKGAKLENVAAILNLTSRTLRRKLVAEGSRFQQLKDNTRRDKAITLFEQSNLSLGQISLACGFTELATFSRAFKHWTGVPPNTYRNYHSQRALPIKGK